MALLTKILTKGQFLRLFDSAKVFLWVFNLTLLGLVLPGLTFAQVRFNAPNMGAPGNRESGAARSGSCVTSDRGLVSLIPSSNLGLTTAAYPSFFAYIPPTTASVGEFTLFTSDTDQEIYKTTLDIAGKSGILQIRLPENPGVAPLEVGKTYYWFVTIVCNPNDRSADIVVQSSIQRVNTPAELLEQLKSGPILTRAELYAQSGLWQDALSSLGTMRLQSPNDPKLLAAWAELLNSVGLQTVADQPLLRP